MSVASTAVPRATEALKGGKSLSNSPEQVVATADVTLPDASSRFRLASRADGLLPPRRPEKPLRGSLLAAVRSPVMSVDVLFDLHRDLVDRGRQLQDCCEISMRSRFCFSSAWTSSHWL